MTRKGKPCPILAEAIAKDGRWLCHVHHPDLLYQQQVKARREIEAEDRAPRREQRRSRRQERKLRQWNQRLKARCETPGLDAPITLSPDAGRTFPKDRRETAS